MYLSGNECPHYGFCPKFFKIQNIWIDLKCTSHFGVRSGGRSKFCKKLGLIFGHPYRFNSTQICLRTTLEVTEDQHRK